MRRSRRRLRTRHRFLAIEDERETGAAARGFSGDTRLPGRSAVNGDDFNRPAPVLQCDLVLQGDSQAFSPAASRNPKTSAKPATMPVPACAMKPRADVAVEDISGSHSACACADSGTPQRTAHRDPDGAVGRTHSSDREGHAKAMIPCGRRCTALEASARHREATSARAALTPAARAGSA